MSFYDLSKEDRIILVLKIKQELFKDIKNNNLDAFIKYFSDEDTYIRKSAYQAIGKIYFSEEKYKKTLIQLLFGLLKHPNDKIRQTTVNAAGEIGIKEFELTEYFFDHALFDKHHSVRNAVIGSMKKMGEKNPKPIINWAKKYLHHEDKEIRREICHGIELRGRTHPQDILPLLQALENDKSARVRNTLIHVLGQIAYKKGCLEIVLSELNKWTNIPLIKAALEEIIDVHFRYRNFSFYTQAEAKAKIHELMPSKVRES